MRAAASTATCRRTAQSMGSWRTTTAEALAEHHVLVIGRLVHVVCWVDVALVAVTAKLLVVGTKRGLVRR